MFVHEGGHLFFFKIYEVQMKEIHLPLSLFGRGYVMHEDKTLSFLTINEKMWCIFGGVLSTSLVGIAFILIFKLTKSKLNLYQFFLIIIPLYIFLLEFPLYVIFVSDIAESDITIAYKHSQIDTERILVAGMFFSGWLHSITLNMIIDYFTYSNLRLDILSEGDPALHQILVGTDQVSNVKKDMPVWH